MASLTLSSKFAINGGEAYVERLLNGAVKAEVDEVDNFIARKFS